MYPWRVSTNALLVYRYVSVTVQEPTRDSSKTQKLATGVLRRDMRVLEEGAPDWPGPSPSSPPLQPGCCHRSPEYAQLLRS
mmetsp:Transcript_4181/g.6472  ORF Transcript_4181/g.6472 Transcript_4181/m.6472 type:complete len:81 (-) Transcript_4181:21-263(-)